MRRRARRTCAACAASRGQAVGEEEGGEREGSGPRRHLHARRGREWRPLAPRFGGRLLPCAERDACECSVYCSAATVRTSPRPLSTRLAATETRVSACIRLDCTLRPTSASARLGSAAPLAQQGTRALQPARTASSARAPSDHTHSLAPPARAQRDRCTSAPSSRPLSHLALA